MTTSTVGLIAGLLFAIAIAVGGFGGFLLALVAVVIASVGWTRRRHAAPPGPVHDPAPAEGASRAS